MLEWWLRDEQGEDRCPRLRTESDSHKAPGVEYHVAGQLGDMIQPEHRTVNRAPSK
jgi:hypothetical protein